MDNFEEKLVHGDREELNELKSFLFRENIRLTTAGKELETAQAKLQQMQQQFLKEKIQFQEEMKLLNHKISGERKRLKDENIFFSKKMEILKNGFAQLDLDRRRLDKEWARLQAEKELADSNSHYYNEYVDVSMFFKGVKNPLSLKKRYKELIKIFHPDNVSGDHEMIQRINKEYEQLKREYEKTKQA